jgi:hypothetical protein
MQHEIVFVVTIVSTNTFKLFNVNELEVSVGQLVNCNVCAQNVFITMQKILCLFKILTKFNLLEFMS